MTLWILCAGSLGCSYLGMPEPVVSPVRVHVENHYADDVDVRAVHQSAADPIGRVGHDTSRVLDVPGGIPLYDLRLLVEARGSDDRFLTGELNVIPGDEVHLTVQADLSDSSYEIGSLEAHDSSPRADTPAPLLSRTETTPNDERRTQDVSQSP